MYKFLSDRSGWGVLECQRYFTELLEVGTALDDERSASITFGAFDWKVHVVAVPITQPFGDPVFVVVTAQYEIDTVL